jgi:CheY-like chemotaxis protein
VDDGTTITIDIPFEIHKGSENKEIQDEATSSKSIEGKKILVADDNFLNLTIVSHILVKEKTDFKMVKDGLEALEALQNDTYDIVLLDINMPNLSGEELIMRRNEVNTTNPNTPFVAMTGNSTKEDVIVYKSLGFIDVIPKPYSTEQFTEIVKKHL